MIPLSKESSRRKHLTPRSDPSHSTRSMEESQDHFFVSGGIRKRRIFYNVKYTEQEKKWIRELRAALKAEKGIQIEEKQTLLRYYYSSNLDMKACLQKLVGYYQWFNSPDIQVLSKQGRQLLRQGFVYNYAVGADGHPFQIMNLGDMDFDKYPLECFFQVLNYVNNRVIKQQFVPGSIETYDYILDLNEKFLSLPITSLNAYISRISNAYSMRMRKMYIVNCTSFAKFLYMGVEKVLSEETARKIQLFTKEDIENGKLREHLDQSVLEIKYGGKHPNINHEQVYMNYLSLQRQKMDFTEQTQYYSVDENNSMFIKGEPVQPCCTPPECSIY